ncbi:putative anti-sigma regulatory factor, serine/threonine protein kinase [Pseudopedobacter saltans DSM 12145]|uniref:Anti-sigma regulatory factor, serine/threonine protein kinase n=1 Tax=Pseudopedobacter saltans (strain ATCC 51119 / DSM 12145 / JCM 21818 / CCUG 39354 / LMG 10337 / NBRC 100064 / NCIMB 13643) TaxID=762903 RepID=F0S9L4_PSESL|nr:ATP-binding protein [Pseudopedobacter saltans]ADY53567.1 putative anti-sigma regulatory factor, serine/threonine protein kinase [Pseudopedobacter saltans DSM 12145]
MANITQILDKGLYSLQLPSTSASIALVENFIDNLVPTLNLNDDVYANMMTCVNEAVSNAIVHGNKENPTKIVYINVENIDNRRIIFSIADEGEGFDFNNLPDPTSPENLEKLSGRGIFIMKKLADQCIFNTKGNEVELHFKL